TGVTVLINKCDLNLTMTAHIEEYCKQHDYPIICHFPHDNAVTEAMVNGQVITEFDNKHARSLLEAAWKNMLTLLQE
ncbi:(4Fe-4S)-binding protein, partial [Pseudodesulfovibrio sp.]|nr:(4Fe-4S)-binding protein [Pseudodesulfovibrio sp.]